MKVFQGVVKYPQQDMNTPKLSYASNWRTNTSAPKSDFTTFSYNKPKRISFKGWADNFIKKFINNDKDNNVSSKIKFKELTDEEFEVKKAELETKIKYSPKDIKKKLKGVDFFYINKYNIFLLGSILDNPQLLEHKDFTDQIKDIIDFSNTGEEAKARIDVIDKIVQTPQLFEYKNFTDKIGEIIYDSSTAENAKAKSEIIDKIGEHQELFDNKNFTDYLGDIINNTNKIEQAQIKLQTIDEYSNHEIAKNSLGGIVNLVSTQEQYEFVTKYFNGDKSPIYIALNHALKNKDQLKSGIENISDGEIFESFIENYKNIESTIDTVGIGTFEASYPLKLDRVEDYAKDIAELKQSLSLKNHEALMQKINPTHSVEYKKKNVKLQNEITELKQQFPQAQTVGDETLQNLKNNINTKSRELKDLQIEQKNQTTMTPQEIVSKTRALAGVNKGVNKDGNNDEIISSFINVIDKNDEWTPLVNKTIYNKFGISDYKTLSKTLKLDKSEYLGEILSADEDFDDNFKILLNTVNDGLVDGKNIKETFNQMPQNIETKKIYKEMGINYDKWVDIDKNSYVPITVTLSAEEAKQSAIKNLEADFNDPAFEKLPKLETTKLIDKLKCSNYELISREEPTYDDDGITIGTKVSKRLYTNGKPIEFEDLGKITSIIKDELNTNNFWTVKSDNEDINSAKDTMYNHLIKLRTNEYQNAKSLKNDIVSDLEIRKTDMNDVSHSLFLGNHGACCTAVGTGINQVSAPTYVMNKCIGAIEVVDSNVVGGSNFAGNTMCYIAKVDDKPSLLLDNIELSTRYQGNKQIRDGIVKYAKQLCKEIATQPDGSVNDDIANMPIYAGPYRHKVDLSDKEFKSHKLQISGSTGKQEIYIDYATSPDYVVDNKKTDKVELYKLSE